MAKTLLIDTWESGGEIDENILLANGIAGMIMCLNDISGGHHMDENFIVQWEQARALPVRIPYFVYNPWKNGQENYDWLAAHIPDECGAVMVDVEVRYTGYSPDIYASELEKFKTLVAAKYNYLIYTGQGYLDLCTYWPDAGYWWAAYPLAFYQYETITWDVLRARLETIPRPANEFRIPGSGILKMWQFTGDRIILPGCNKRMDVNVFYGTLDELKAFANEKPTDPDTPPDGARLISEREYYPGAFYRQYEIRLPVSGLTTYHVLEFDSDQAELFVSPRPLGNNYVPQLTKKYGQDFGMNCDGFVGNNITGYAISNGVPYGTQNVEETLYISKNNGFTLTRPSVLNMAFSFPNVLVRDGVIPYIDKGDDWRARSAFGYTKDQSKFFFVVVDGKDYLEQVGASFKETAAIMLELGCFFAVMCDGGGSSTLAAMDNGFPELLNKAWGEEPEVGYFEGYSYKMRPVAQILGVKMKSDVIVIPPEGGNMFTVKKSARFRSLPTMTTNDQGASSVVGETFESATTVLDINNPSITMVQHTNGKWLPLEINGVVYTSGEVVTLPPPTESSFVSATLTRADGTHVDFDLVPKA